MIACVGGFEHKVLEYVQLSLCEGRSIHYGAAGLRWHVLDGFHET